MTVRRFVSLRKFLSKSWMLICVIILLVREEFLLLYILGVWTSFTKFILTFHVLILILFDNNILFIYRYVYIYVRS